MNHRLYKYLDNMNLIKTSSYEDDYMCPICYETFKEKDKIILIKHCVKSKPEKIAQSRQRKHIFHVNCMLSYIETLNSNPTCPLDREEICKLIPVKYFDIIALNIINFSNNYYELLDKCQQNDTMQVSIVDHINLNYKDINGKTLLYCACQRGNIKLVKQLVRLGANPTISDDNRFTPLMASVSHNYVNITKFLLTLPIIVNNINQCDKRNKTAIEYAFDANNYQIVIELLHSHNIDRDVLHIILSQSQNIKTNDSKYNSILMDIKNTIRKQLDIKVNIECKFPATLGMSKWLIKETPMTIIRPSFDITENVFNMVYNPIAHSDLIIPEFNEQEIEESTRFDDLQDDLIYQPQ